MGFFAGTSIVFFKMPNRFDTSYANDVLNLGSVIKLNEIEYAAKIARTSRRSASNEASLVWSAAAIMVTISILVWVPGLFMDQISLRMNPFAFAIIMGALIGGAISYCYLLYARKVIGAAVFKDNEIRKRLSAKAEEEKQNKIRIMLLNEKT